MLCYGAGCELIKHSYAGTCRYIVLISQSVPPLPSCELHWKYGPAILTLAARSMPAMSQAYSVYATSSLPPLSMQFSQLCKHPLLGPFEPSPGVVLFATGSRTMLCLLWGLRPTPCPCASGVDREVESMAAPGWNLQQSLKWPIPGSLRSPLSASPSC